MRCLYCHNPDTWHGGGTPYEPCEVLERMTRNLPFYKTGGLTVSGGEPLLQLDFLIELFTLAKSQGIHTCLDTSGATFDKKNGELIKKMDKLLTLTDLFMLDIKHTDENEHVKLTGHTQKNILDFLDYLNQNGAKIRIRHVLIPEITDNEVYLKQLGRLLAPIKNLEKIEVLPFHKMGEVKYEALGIKCQLKDTPALSQLDAERAFKTIQSVLSQLKIF